MGGFAITITCDPRSLLERVAALAEAAKHPASKAGWEKLRTKFLVAIERGQARQTRRVVGTIVAAGDLAFSTRVENALDALLLTGKGRRGYNKTLPMGPAMLRWIARFAAAGRLAEKSAL